MHYIKPIEPPTPYNLRGEPVIGPAQTAGLPAQAEPPPPAQRIGRRADLSIPDGRQHDTLIRIAQLRADYGPYWTDDPTIGE